MWTNLAVILFLVLQLLFFGSQGLFSAMLHLVVVLIAGALALAAWEPLTLGFLIDRMPETAWGVGLIAPFILFTLVLRLILDRLVIGNVMFPQAVNWAAGAVVGLVSGILVAGLGIIGVQFLGGVDMQYTPYRQTASGGIERHQKLWVPVDDLAGSVFTTLSDGAFSPWSGHTVSRRHGGLARAAGTFGRTARPHARRSIRPMNIEVGRMMRLTSARLRAARDELDLPPGLASGADAALLAVETEINLAGATDAGGAADADGRFTATPAQVALIANDPDGGTTTFHPVGYVVDQAYGSFRRDRDAASSSAGASEALVWLFDVPEEVEPRWFRMKQTPLALPEPAPEDAALTWVGEVAWRPEPGTDADPNGDGDGGANNGRTAADSGDISIEATAELPVRLSKNWVNTSVGGGTYDGQGIVEARGGVRMQKGERIYGNLLLDHYAPRQGPPIIRVAIDRRQLRGLIGRALQFAEDATPPLLLTEGGETYHAIGYVIHGGGSSIHLHLTSRIVRSLSDDRVQEMDPDERLYLYFHVDEGARITQFKMGRETHEFDPPITP